MSSTSTVWEQQNVITLAFLDVQSQGNKDYIKIKRKANNPSQNASTCKRQHMWVCW
jgi:hypothetical protein